MISFKEFMSESINDKGIMKAIFIVGIPGAGKSYTASKITGGISPRIVNTDKATELFIRKGSKVNAETWPKFKDTAHKITKASLSNYVNGLLPLFIDGTSNDASNILHRSGILESLGYDVGMIFIDTDVELAIKRANERLKHTGREVGEDFIRAVEAEAAENRKFFQSKFSFFEIIKNNDGELTDDTLTAAYKKVSKFFEAPIANPVGKRTLAEMTEKKQKYLTPEIMSKDALDHKIDGWYRT